MPLSLVQLASQDSSDKRRELLQEVSNLFVEGVDAHTDRELLLFGDVLARLLDKVDVMDRQELAERVASLERTPRELTLKLANDELDVAAPILTHSPVLTDADLVDLASRKGQQHLMAISQRAVLSEGVTDVLVVRGDTAVLNTVTRNLGARFSESGFETLAEKACDDSSLGDALSFRADMPPQIASQLVKTLPQVARDRLQFLIERGQAQVSELVEDARREIESVRAENRRSRLELRVMIAEVREGRRRIDQVVDDLVFRRRLVDITIVFAELANVPEAHVHNALHKVNAAAIAVVCRCLDLSETTFERLMRLRCDRLDLPQAQAEPMTRVFAQLDKASAERALRFHKVRSNVVHKSA